MTNNSRLIAFWCNTVSREELKALVGVKMDTRDNNMDTYPESATQKGQALEA